MDVVLSTTLRLFDGDLRDRRRFLESRTLGLASSIIVAHEYNTFRAGSVRLACSNACC